MPDKQNSNLMRNRHKTTVELFQSVATFGFLSAALFCLGGPTILVLSPGLSMCFRHVLIVASGIAGFAIAACVLVFYCLLARPTVRAESADEESAAEEEADGRP